MTFRTGIMAAFAKMLVKSRLFCLIGNRYCGIGA